LFLLTEVINFTTAKQLAAKEMWPMSERTIDFEHNGKPALEAVPKRPR
jgi:hypothetical protein